MYRILGYAAYFLEQAGLDPEVAYNFVLGKEEVSGVCKRLLRNFTEKGVCRRNGVFAIGKLYNDLIPVDEQSTTPS